MAFDTYLISGFTFKSTALSSKGSCSVDEFATVNRHSADSSRTVNLISVDQKGVTITIEVADQGQAGQWDVGEVGGLSITALKRTGGDGLSGTQTITVTNSCLVNKTPSYESENEGTLIFTFEAYDPNADATSSSSLITYSV